ncbi:MAG: uroporphyrinogen-III synthase [Bacteroidota bacterium]
MKTSRLLISTKTISTQERDWWAQAGVRLKAYPMIENTLLAVDLDHELGEEILVFTSKNAVKAVLNASKPPQLQALQSKTIASIAPATSQYLQKHSVPVSCEASNSADLAKKIIASYPPQPIRYFTKEDRLDVLPAELSQAKFEVGESIVYQTQARPQIVHWGEAEGAFFYSPSAVRSFFELNQWPQDKIAYAIGSTTAQALLAAKVDSIQIAEIPSRAGLLASIQSTFNSIYP